MVQRRPAVGLGRDRLVDRCPEPGQLGGGPRPIGFLLEVRPDPAEPDGRSGRHVGDRLSEDLDRQPAASQTRLDLEVDLEIESSARTPSSARTAVPARTAVAARAAAAAASVRARTTGSPPATAIPSAIAAAIPLTGIG